MKKYYKVVGIVIIIFIISFFAVRSFSKSSKAARNSSDQSEKAKATANIGKSFEFKAININKKEIPVTFTIDTVERKDEIKLQGESRTAPAGKDYVLVRIEIENKSTERVAIATADRVRLQGENNKLYAPDYHNGNVVIDPLAVKRDLLAFSVPSDVKSLVFLVGELDGEKQKVEVNF